MILRVHAGNRCGAALAMVPSKHRHVTAGKRHALALAGRHPLTLPGCFKLATRGVELRSLACVYNSGQL
jgi:hypothetical protein